MIKMTLTAEKKLAEALPHGIVVLDAHGTIQWSNKIACLLLSLNSSHSNHINEIITNEIFAEFLGKEDPEDIELYAPHNANIRLSISRRRYLQDQQVLIIRDITHRYRLEKMRQDFIANVSHELRTPLTVFRGYLEVLLDLGSMNE